MAEAADILRKAKELVETRGWTQGAFARNKRGQPVSPTLGAKGAVCFCATGAIIVAGRNSTEGPYRITHDLFERAAHLRKSCIAEWNDRKGRTKEQVLAAFDKAIQLAEAEQ